MAEFIEFEAGEEGEDGYDSSNEDAEDIGLSESERNDFIDDENVKEDVGLPPNPYLDQDIRYPRGLHRVIKKV